jgi:hypothetical protein
MPTATKTKSVTDELRELEQERDRLHGEARAARAEMNAWEAELPVLQAKLTEHLGQHPEEAEGLNQQILPGTRAEKLRNAIRDRRAQPNPSEPEYGKALAAFHDADLRCRAFKQRTLPARLGELEPVHDAAEATIRQGFALVAEGCGEYSDGFEQVRSLLADTDPRGGQRLIVDGRVNDWAKLAQAVIDGEEIVRPGVSDLEGSQ